MKGIAPFVPELYELLRLPEQPDDYTLRDSDYRRLRLRVRSPPPFEDLAWSGFSGLGAFQSS